MSSRAHAEPPSADLLGTVERLARTRVSALEPLAGGRNSRVFRARLDDGRDVAVKACFRHPNDPRDRTGVEFDALRLMWKHGFRDVPEPLVASRSAGVALCEFIPGTAPQQLRAADIDALVDFLARLRVLARQPDCQQLGPASEACFSVASMVDVLHARRARLKSPEGGLRRLAALQAFLRDEFDPALDRIVRWSRAKLPRG
ncbi:MAG: hypothetical protein ABMA26_22545, partial [Limisphaerales bacterium]